jgi:hypothetical protein
MAGPNSNRCTVLALAYPAAALLIGAVSGGCAVDFGPADEEGVESSAAGLGSPYDFQPIAPCLSRLDYIPRGVVQFGLGRAPYTPRCVRLATGGTVVFQGSFLDHPLVPRSLGSAPSPIQPTLAGGSVEFEFSDFGFFPFQCAEHPEETGVIWASWAF